MKMTPVWATFTIGHASTTALLGILLTAYTPAAWAAGDEPNLSTSSSDRDANKERRDWMNKGNAEYVQKNWEAARDAYRKSWDIKHHYTIAANLADVEMKMGHYSEAAGYLKYVLANLPENKATERKLAENQLMECRNHLTVVRVATDVVDATVLVDGRDVGQTPLREDVLLEPGKHVISVTKPGYGEATQELSAEGSKVEVTLTLERESAPTPTAQQSVTSAMEPQPLSGRETKSSHAQGYRIGAYIGLGLGAVGIGAGTYFLLKSHRDQTDSDDLYAACTPNCTRIQRANIDDWDQSARDQRNAGIISYVIGGLGVATGVTLLVLDANQGRETAKPYIAPWVGLGRAGVVGAF